MEIIEVEMYKIFSDIAPHLKSLRRVGSRVTCDPPPLDTDEDWLLLVDESFFNSGMSVLNDNGFDLDNPGKHYRPEQTTFNSWRGGNVNLIITADEDWHYKFEYATEKAKRLNILEKSERVEMFQGILYG